MARTLAYVLALVGFAHSCAPTEQIAPDEADLIAQGRRFVESRAYRRSVLEQGIVSTDNVYSSLRLANYATAVGGWDALPVSLPTTRPFRPDGGAEQTSDWSVQWTHEGLLKAGEHAFMNYPMRADRRLEPLRKVRGEATGFWVAAGRTSLVEVADHLAWTCATCHARPDGDGALQVGVPNSDVDIAALYRLGNEPNSVVDTWHAGTVDPSDDGTNNPSTIGDLRAVRFQSHLHWTATLRNSLIALAIRVETLYIVSTGETTRPPRELAFAIAYYLWNLGEEPSEQRSDVFETNCGTCHHADGTVGPPLPWAEQHPGRGTGYHRVPSLVGVGDRGRLLHDGRFTSVVELITSGPAWHAYGRDLRDEDRAELVAYVGRHFALPGR